jgi:hypothetical protein
VILIVYGAQIPRNDVDNGTIFEWRVEARTIRRLIFEVINADVMENTFIIKDFGYNRNMK